MEQKTYGTSKRVTRVLLRAYESVGRNAGISAKIIAMDENALPDIGSNKPNQVSHDAPSYQLDLGLGIDRGRRDRVDLRAALFGGHSPDGRRRFPGCPRYGA